MDMDMSSSSMSSMASSSMGSMVSSMASAMASSMASSMVMSMGSSSSAASSSTGMAMVMASTSATASSSASASSTMAMAMSSSSSTSSSMDMSSDDMSMNVWLTTSYSGYPVIFKTMKASSGGAAFGIFCALFFSAFFWKGLTFLNAYLEQRVFKEDVNHCGPYHYTGDEVITSKNANSLDTNGKEVEGDGCPGCADDVQPNSSTTDLEDNPASLSKHQIKALKNRSILARFFDQTPTSIYRDIIRLVIAFVQVMIGYALMLAAMSFIILYFFAICLGYAFGEIFFLRLAKCIDIDPAKAVCGSLH